MKTSLKQRYLFAKMIVIDEGFSHEIAWQSNLCFDDVDESTFLREIGWVILSSGMKSKVVQKIFNNISTCFYNWKAANVIAKNEGRCFQEALRFFNNKSKISAIIDAAKKVQSFGFCKLKELIKKNPLEVLLGFKYIGPTTVYHLAKNIGLPFAKPDRHLKRIAESENYYSVQDLCEDISKSCGDSVPVVDIVLWRFATIEPNYIKVLNSVKF